MKNDKTDHLLSSLKFSLCHPFFYSRVFSLLAKEKKIEECKKTNSINTILTDEYEALSRRLDRAEIQESCAVRNILRSRKLAQALINPKGELQENLLVGAIEHLKAHLYSLGPSRHYDAKRQEHILKVLTYLQTNKDLRRLIKQISQPISNKWADEMIRYTLDLPSGIMISEIHAKQAVLAAWFSYLRQNVGSCFATAPAELIHDEQPNLFLQDMLDMFSTGRLKRTFGGIEYAVPLSASWGNGDLKKPLLIRTTVDGIFPEIWFSQGLIAAFESAGCFKPSLGLKQKVEKLEKWIKPLVERPFSHPQCIITAEEIIRRILMQFLGLTDQQIKEYDKRSPTPFIQRQLFIQSSPLVKRKEGINERCAQFYHFFEVAKNAFKSLADNALLKGWEFTLASFSETKYAFADWNLYESLGLGTHEPGGIGQCIFHLIQQKLDHLKQYNQELEYDYEGMYTQVKTLESRIRHASTEKEIDWLKMEYRSRVGELDFLQEQRQEGQYQSRALVDLYDTLYKLYNELFRDYFQEVYDADMQDIQSGPFDDSPAGFRLLYKHGRSNTSQWTLIKNHHEFIESLTSFFVATEPQVLHALETQRMEKVLSEVVSAIIMHIKTDEFLESAFRRMAIAHKTPLVENPLEHLDQIEKKPWVFTSGGVMTTLISCYYKIDQKPAVVEKWVESETELLVFLADTLKLIPPKIMQPYKLGLHQGMLMQSPTHAFILKPFLSPFRETWENEQFTFTFIRDQFIIPAESFVERILLNDEMIQFIIRQFIEKIPANFQPRFKAVFEQLRGPLNPIFFREKMVDLLAKDRGLRFGSQLLLSPDEIDHLLYKYLPFSPNYQIRERLSQILTLLPGLTDIHKENFFELFEKLPLEEGDVSFISAQQLQDICKGILAIVFTSTDAPDDYHYHVSLAAQRLGFAMPTPIIFADSNWVKDEFGFTVNPGTGRFELWRFDYTGSEGYPMSSWKQWVDGTRSDLKWGVYTKPYEYGQI